MKQILIIDDLRTFDFDQNPNIEFIYARNSEEAINELRQLNFDEVWFDHDLGGQDTAMNVVDWIESTVFNEDEKNASYW